MAFAIMKLSYNSPGDSRLTGGICGTGFFVDSRTAVTAHHVLNCKTFEPNASGYAVVSQLYFPGGTIMDYSFATRSYPDLTICLGSWVPIVSLICSR